ATTSRRSSPPSATAPRRRGRTSSPSSSPRPTPSRMPAPACAPTSPSRERPWPCCCRAWRRPPPWRRRSPPLPWWSRPPRRHLAHGAARLPRRLGAALGGVGARLRHLEKDLDRLTGTLAGDSRLLDQVAGALDQDVRRARMLPFAEACQGLDRMVHDLAGAAG